MIVKINSKKIYQNFAKQCKKNNDYSNLIKDTRDKLTFEYTSLCEGINPSTYLALLNKLQKIEFKLKWNFSIIISIFTGIVSGLVIFLFGTSDIFSATSNQMHYIAYVISVTFLLFIIACISFLFASQVITTLEKWHRDTYMLFILPYERHIIIDILKEKYDVEYEKFSPIYTPVSTKV